MAHCIVYFSTSAWMFSQEDILGILQQSRQHNAQVGITGVLLYIGGHIIQVLEGEQQALDTLYQRIKADQRHNHVTCVLNKSVEKRLFSEWSMGYQTLTSEQFEEVRTIIDLDRKAPVTGKDQDPAIIKTLKAFYKINHQL